MSLKNVHLKEVHPEEPDIQKSKTMDILDLVDYITDEDSRLIYKKYASRSLHKLATYVRTFYVMLGYLLKLCTWIFGVAENK